MKSLAITLCFLLLVLPAGAQQIALRSAPNFYVPYGVSLTQPEPLAGESSSDAMRAAEPDDPLPRAPQPQRYPVRRPRRRFGPPFMAYPPTPQILARTGAIVGVVMIGMLVMALVGGDR